jgi:hypothetical protein
MYDKLYGFLVETATWPRVFLLAALFLLIVGVFDLRRKALGHENPALDGRRRGYSPEDARKFFEAIGPDGRKLYANTELSLDVAFPLVYGSLFAALLILLYGQVSARYRVLVPLLTVVMDLAENVTLAFLASRFDGKASPLARVAAVFTLLKFVLFVLSLLLILFGVVAAAWG